MSAVFTVNAYDRLDINLPFQEAAYITLIGNITTYVAVVIIMRQNTILTTSSQCPIPKFNVDRAIHS